MPVSLNDRLALITRNLEQAGLFLSASFCAVVIHDTLSVLSQRTTWVTPFSSLLHWQHITLDSYIPCLTDLCKALWEVMLSYHRTMQWHEEHDGRESSPGPGK